MRFLKRLLGPMVALALVAMAAFMFLSRKADFPLPAGANGLLFDVPSTAYPFTHRFVGLPSGARVHYLDEGKGPTLLFLHGNPTWSYLYRHLVKDLSSSYRCVALDYPGFGHSTAPEGYRYTPREHSRVVEEFVDKLGLNDLTLMVQDWGGPIGLGFAGRRPEKISRLVIGNTWAQQADERLARFSWLMGGPVGRFLQLHMNAIPFLFLKQGTTRELSAQELRMYAYPFRAPGRREPPAIFPREIVASRDYLAELEARLPLLAKKPALILWGTADNAFPPPRQERFEKLFPDHRTVMLQGAGHYIQEDAPEEIIQAIRDFVPAAPPAAGAR